MAKARPRASLIYNPNAGRRRHADGLDAIRSALLQSYELEITPTAGPRDAIRLAREAATRDDAAVFAWGGDGTVREVVEGILGSPIALGVLPGGTFNVVARAIGVPRRDPVRAAGMLASAHPQLRDVGLVGDAPFVMQATAGIDGFLMHHMRADLKAKFGMFAAVIDGARALARYTFPQFEVEVDGRTHSATGAAFVNMAEYAGNFHFVPGARWDDRQGHVLLHQGRTRLTASLFALSLAVGRHHLRRDVKILPAETLTIRSSDAIYVQADGDPWRGSLPVTCRLSKDQINVLIPEPTAR